jgi:hypothetical protein
MRTYRSRIIVTPGIGFVVSAAVWLLAGLVWLLPQKMAILKRVGNLTNNQLFHLAKAGEAEIRIFLRRGWWYVRIGLLLLVPHALLMQFSKLHG